jgi:hypothetical protein
LWLREIPAPPCLPLSALLCNITIPVYVHVDESNLIPVAVGLSLMLPIVFAKGMLEFYFNNGKVTMETMFEDPFDLIILD